MVFMMHRTRITSIKKLGHIDIDDKRNDEDIDGWAEAGQQNVLTPRSWHSNSREWSKFVRNRDLD